MEYINYSVPHPDPLPAAFEGREPEFVARIMIANPGTDFRTAVRDFERLMDNLASGRTPSAAGDLGAWSSPEALHRSVIAGELQAYAGDHRTDAEIVAKLEQRAGEIWHSLPYTEEGAPHLGHALRREVSVETRYREVQALQEKASTATVSADVRRAMDIGLPPGKSTASAGAGPRAAAGAGASPGAGAGASPSASAAAPASSAAVDAAREVAARVAEVTRAATQRQPDNRGVSR